MYPLDGILYIFWITFLILHQKPFNLPCNSQWMIWWCKQSPWHFISLLRLIFARSVLGLVVLTLVRLKTLQTFQTFCQLNYSIMISERRLYPSPGTMRGTLPVLDQSHTFQSDGLSHSSLCSTNCDSCWYVPQISDLTGCC